MANVLRNPGDLVNASLVRIGYKRLISHLQDGSEAARAALAIFGQTRDDLVRSQDWGFPTRSAPLDLLKEAPANNTYLVPWTDAFPPLPWKYEYGYLPDMIRLRAVKPTPIFIPEMDPTPYPFQIYNDASFDPPQRVILCNVADAIGVYNGQVTDPLTWPPDFVEAFVGKLAELLAPGLTGPAMADMEAKESREQTFEAAREDG